jgi:lipid A 3-O-deacylase
MIKSSRLGPLLISLWAATLTSSNSAEPSPQPSTENSIAGPEVKLETPAASIWQGDVGEGFRSTVQTVSVEAGVAVGMATFGSRQAHDMALMSLSYGHMLGPVIGEGHWFRGNLELRGELFGGGQFSPESQWLLGLTPHLRYNFATGTRWIPFLDGGAGVSATGIGHPDIGGTFEFNLQGCGGVHWFLRDDLALTGEVKYMHLSDAGIHHPNLGVNDIVGLIGVTLFFK